MPSDEQTLLSCESKTPMRVVRLEGGANFCARLGNMGLTEGKIVTKVHQQLFRGPVTVQIQNTQLAIGHAMAGRIIVAPVS